MERPSWTTSQVDLTRPSTARVYDYYLGGAHNFAVDRELAEQALRVVPELRQVVQLNRAFLRRAVQFCIEEGIRQFLDIGSGLPTVGNVHEVAQRLDPAARVVYVDHDPVAVAQSRAMLKDNDLADAALADLRQPDQVLGAEEVERLLDLNRPVAVLLVAVLHFVPESDEPAKLVAQYREVIVPGSYMVVSHATDEESDGGAERVAELYQRSPTPLIFRDATQVEQLLSGFELAEPGVVYVPAWHPDSTQEVQDRPERSGLYAAVGRRV